MYDKIGWGDGRRLWGLAIDPWCEEVKVVVFRKHPCGSLLHKIAVLGGGGNSLGRTFFLHYEWGWFDSLKVEGRIQGSNMAYLRWKGLNCRDQEKCRPYEDLFILQNIFT